MLLSEFFLFFFFFTLKKTEQGAVHRMTELGWGGGGLIGSFLSEDLLRWQV